MRLTRRTPIIMAVSLASCSASIFVASAFASDSGNNSVTSSATANSGLPVFNFRTAPMGLLTASPGLNVDIGLGPSWSIGPTFQYFNDTQGTTDNNLYQFGFQTAYYFNHERYYNSWYSRATVVALKSGASNTRTSRSLTSWIESISGGYSFRFGETHFNAMLGTGISYFANSASEGVQPLLEIFLGWAI